MWESVYFGFIIWHCCLFASIQTYWGAGREMMAMTRKISFHFLNCSPAWSASPRRGFQYWFFNATFPSFSAMNDHGRIFTHFGSLPKNIEGESFLLFLNMWMERWYFLQSENIWCGREGTKIASTSSGSRRGKLDNCAKCVMRKNRNYTENMMMIIFKNDKLEHHIISYLISLISLLFKIKYHLRWR